MVKFGFSLGEREPAGKSGSQEFLVAIIRERHQCTAGRSDRISCGFYIEQWGFGVGWAVGEKASGK